LVGATEHDVNVGATPTVGALSSALDSKTFVEPIQSTDGDLGLVAEPAAACPPTSTGVCTSFAVLVATVRCRRRPCGAELLLETFRDRELDAAAV
jgi:hypothetical protein